MNFAEAIDIDKLIKMLSLQLAKIVSGIVAYIMIVL